jgi:hypothetical protein
LGPWAAQVLLEQLLEQVLLEQVLLEQVLLEQVLELEQVLVVRVWWVT